MDTVLQNDLEAKSAREFFGELFFLDSTGKARLCSFCFIHESRLWSWSSHLISLRERPRELQRCWP